ncbi:MAG: glycosyltransferase family 39 protein [Candidatus Margulisbacteria bacterium]|nr:glycosyltransferase family 39 protein [Candidatus Margulisiibacteriota bacterium]
MDRLNLFKNNRTFFFLLLILLAGAALRLYDPTFRSLWGDESHSALTAVKIAGHAVILQQAEAGLVRDFHPPVYFVLLSGWTAVFGAGEYALRSFSIAAGILALFCFYFFARELFDEKTALIGTGLLAFSPLAVMQAQEIRNYSLLFLFALLSAWFFWKLLAGRFNLTAAAGYVVFSALLLLTHFYGLLLLIAQFVFLVFAAWRRGEWARGLKLFGLQFLAGLPAAYTYIRFLLIAFIPMIGSAVDMPFSVFPWYLRGLLFFFVLALGETVAPWNYLVVIPAALLIGYLLLKNIPKDEKVQYLWFMLLVPVVIAALFLKATQPKYLIVTLPFFLLLIGRPLAQFKFKPAILLIGLLLALQSVSLFNYFNLKEYHNSNQIEPWRAVTAGIKDRYRAGDIVIGSNRSVYRLLVYYLNVAGGKSCLIGSVQGRDDAKYLSTDISQIPLYDDEGKMIAAPIAPRRIWFVSHINDGHSFPTADYIDRIKLNLLKRYRVVSESKYLPYEQTLVAKLPIKRHKSGAARIVLTLYSRQ